MKRLILLSFFCLPLIASAQSKADYEKVMSRFVKFYNSKQGDSIVNLFDPKYRQELIRLWTPEEMEGMHKKYGKIESYKFLRSDAQHQNATEFTTIFSRIAPNGTGFLLNKSKYFESFALVTSEPKPR